MSWDTAAAVAGVAIPVLGVAGAGARWVGKRWARIDEFIDDWQGTPPRPGVPARPGVMARLDAIEHELRPNSGSSLRDAVNRVDRRTAQAIPTPDDE
ncbi:hypothetical protein [Streptomyces tremellae]|uniref:Minor tail protein n=1 Tax=Streptomyces tremellae TaxID=1124239 RepID=A0ABP7EF88_9ACTN